MLPTHYRQCMSRIKHVWSPKYSAPPTAFIENAMPVCCEFEAQLKSNKTNAFLSVHLQNADQIKQETDRIFWVSNKIAPCSNILLAPWLSMSLAATVLQLYFLRLTTWTCCSTNFKQETEKPFPDSEDLIATHVPMPANKSELFVLAWHSRDRHVPPELLLQTLPPKKMWTGSGCS